ncbi:hypothetical protein AAHE18_03G302200 [Arachis hypogaea]
MILQLKRKLCMPQCEMDSNKTSWNKEAQKVFTPDAKIKTFFLVCLFVLSILMIHTEEGQWNLSAMYDANEENIGVRKVCFFFFVSPRRHKSECEDVKEIKSKRGE